VDVQPTWLTRISANDVLAATQLLRRGLREPDVVEALGSKRLFVKQLPFVVTGAPKP
jgi:hypothetical protein